jgi:hypothetical protein
MIGGTRYVAFATFGHRPSLDTAIKRNVDGAEFERITFGFSAGPEIVRRKDTADEADDRHSMAAVIAQRVDVPPAIAVPAYRRVEMWSESNASAARIPESVAIGTPGPG